MFTYAPRLVQQRSVAPTVYERTPSFMPPSAPRSRTPSLHTSPIVPLSIPTHHNQTLPQSVPVPRHSPEPWVDALKDDVEAEFSLSLVDDLKAAKDATLAAATTPEERAAILREYDESMADIRAQARAEFQRRVEAERERRLLGNFDGKDALIAEQHSIMESIARQKLRGEASHFLATSAPHPQTLLQASAQPHPNVSRPSKPIPIPMQRSNSRNGVSWDSAGARSISFGNAQFTSSSSSSSSSSRPPPRVRRDSTQHSSSRPLPPPTASPAASLNSVSNLSEPSSSHGSYTRNAEIEWHYGEHQATVQRREEEVKRKEATARRHAEEARRREEAAARHEEDARRKNEEATRRMRDAELYEQHVRTMEARARKEIELAQGAGAARARTQSTSAVPRIARVFSKEAWQHKQRSGAGVTVLPRGEVRVRN
jgi:hypothetical protein